MVQSESYGNMMESRMTFQVASNAENANEAIYNSGTITGNAIEASFRHEFCVEG